VRGLIPALLAHAAALAVALAAWHYGLELRRWAWEQTKDIHAQLTVNNALSWGQYANEQGYLKVYDKLVETYGQEGEYVGPGQFSLDYPPLRLLVASWWADWAGEHFGTAPPPQPRRRAMETGRPPQAAIRITRAAVPWKPEYAFNRPMLLLNTSCEAVSAIALFLLVRYWVRRCDLPPESMSPGPAPRPGPCRGLGSGLLAALLLWFSPALIWSAHCYPQWDVWLLPAFLLGVYFTLRNWWLVAGLGIGIAGMAKGQVFLVAPLLLLWPLFSLRLGAVVRLMVGVTLGVGLVASPWLLCCVPHLGWTQCLLLAAFPALAAGLLASRRVWWAAGLAGLLALAVLLWPAWETLLPGWLSNPLRLAGEPASPGMQWVELVCVGALALTPLVLLRNGKWWSLVVRIVAVVVAVILMLWPWLAHERTLSADAADLPELLWQGEPWAWWTARVVLGCLCLLPITLLPGGRWWRHLIRALALVAAGACLAWPSPPDHAAFKSLGALLADHSDRSNILLAGWLLRRAAAGAAVLLPLLVPRAARKPMLEVQAGVVVWAAAGAWWPGLDAPARLAVHLLGALVGGLVVLAWRLPRRALGAFLGAALTASLFLCVPLFGGSMAWYTVGLKYGTRHWKQLFWCRAANLGAILQTVYHWRFADTLDLAAFLPGVKGPWIVELRSLMIAGYALTLILCAAAAARHYRRHDRRFLMAILAPWVLMYALLPQMVDRYAMWAAAISAAVAAISLTGVFLYLALNAMAWAMMALFLFGMSAGSPWSQHWLPWLVPLHPGLGWGWLALAGMTLCLALTPGPTRYSRGTPSPGTPPHGP
jgi:hypothetical protein